MKVQRPHLLISRRFTPLLITQFLGAFHDNLFKSALVVLLLYNPAFQAEISPQILTTLAAALFILPFLIFSPLGGQLADKFSRAHVIRRIKAVEVIIAALGITAFLTTSIELCFATLFCLGTHSALFGPSRYAILPDKLHKDELMAGNALLNMVIFMAILGGTIGGTILAAQDHGPLITGFTMLACALCGYIASLFIPVFPAQHPGTRLALNVAWQVVKIIRYVFVQSQDILFAVMGIGWFYFLGAMFMSQFANYTYTSLGASEGVLTFFLTVFSVGVAGGSLLCGRLLGSQIKATLVPFALSGITFFSHDFYLANQLIERNADGTLLTLEQFLAPLPHWRIVGDLFMIAVCGGLFEVPLNAIIQHHTSDASRASVLAGSALINAFFVILSSVICAIILGSGWSVLDLFLAFAFANLAVTAFSWWWFFYREPNI